MNQIFRVWDKQKYIERCHVVPSALGGCNCHGNLVLLCKECHKDNPDTKNVELFLEWMQNRKKYPERRFEAYENAFSEFNMELSVLNIYLLHECKEFLSYFRSKSISVGKKYSVATIIASFKEWKTNFTEQQLKQKVPEDIKALINRKEQLDLRFIKIILNYYKDIFLDNYHFKKKPN